MLPTSGAKPPQPGAGSACHELGVSTEGRKVGSGNLYIHPLLLVSFRSNPKCTVCEIPLLCSSKTTGNAS